MNNWFTSDLHLGHANIIKYCSRPFKDVDDMNSRLIRNWNERVKPEDTVYHIGDFCFRGGEQGGKTKSQYWEEQLNGKIVHIRGNHDVNNGSKALMTVAIMNFGGYEMLVTHIPPTMKLEVPDFCDFVICGHVHEKWKHRFETGIDVPFINVGVDVWDFRPVSVNELLAYYNQVSKGVVK